MRLIGDGCACPLGSREESIYLGSASHEVAEAELATLRRSGGDLGVLGEVAARVQGEDQPAV